MGRLPGIDISHYQGSVDFDVLASKPVEFVFCKATEYRKDEYFDRNWAECKRIEVTRGAYHVIRLKEDIMSQVYLYLSTVQFEPGDLPPVLDVETSVIDELGDPALAYDHIMHWLITVEELTECTPILYISPRAIRHLEGHTEGLERFWLWNVDYEDPEPGLTKQPEMPEADWTTWMIWQWTSDGPAKEYGMESSGLDMDYFNGCRHDLQAFTEANMPTNPWEPIDVSSAQAYNDDRDYSTQQIHNIIAFTGGNFWYEMDIISKIATWQFQQGDLAVDGKVGPATYQALLDAGMSEA
jgi:GH25 family lysozyme M1 (1,4-beta-N-acetylmuramidase)